MGSGEHASARGAIEVVAELYRRFGEGRLEDTLELMDSEVRLREPGDPAVLPWAGEFRGHDGVRAFYAGLAAGVTSIEIDPNSLRLLEVEGHRVLALGRERGTAAATGRSYVTDSAWLWSVEGGVVTELAAFHDTAAMEAALGGGVDQQRRIETRS